MRRVRYAIDEAAALRAGAVRQGAELRMPCPAHDSSPETLALRDGATAPVWHCHAGCDPAVVRDALLAAGILVRRTGGDAARPDRPADRGAATPPWIRRVWDEAAPIGGTPADDYLRARGLAPPWPKALRWDASRARMIAPAVRDGRLRGLHATRLPGRERRSHGPVNGAAVRLAAVADGRLALAEGIETALAYTALAGIPTWAALSAAGLKNAPLPDGVQRLVIAADFDGAGLVAAEHLQRRARGAGIDVRIHPPAALRHRLGRRARGPDPASRRRLTPAGRASDPTPRRRGRDAPATSSRAGRGSRGPRRTRFPPGRPPPPASLPGQSRTRWPRAHAPPSRPRPNHRRPAALHRRQDAVLRRLATMFGSTDPSPAVHPAALPLEPRHGRAGRVDFGPQPDDLLRTG